ncbi:Gfo/Idh/MocA family oxidoreductase [Chlorobium sp. N1]|uniref:Gfo/Idh/MocA family protein n=1 Tax=Chlorobium sp. N1 TaxID=2491138 RepID=UPI00103D9B43|nr:Gfo/Idh/MocA family oxidoreductase [Chlorobium sp. N1]TCD48707.1 Gfo/Idh/MocA family oxidoreductase [Chlorobium sp. N1]
MKEKVRVGFLGSGWSRIAQAPAFSLMDDAELAAVASPTEKHRKKFMESFAITEGFADWRRLLDCELDLVCVTTPPFLHREMVTALLERGRSVICEKPFALSVAEAESMFNASLVSPGLALLDHQLRMHPAVRTMKQMIESGEIGRVYDVRAIVNLSSRSRPDLQWSWWSDRERGGGALGAIGSHLIDLNRFLIGEIAEVSCNLTTSVPQRPDREGRMRAATSDDSFSMQMRFGPSSIALAAPSLMQVTTVGSYTWFSFEVSGSLKSIRLDGAGRLWEVGTGGSKGSRSLVDAPRWTQVEPILPWDELVLQEKIRHSSLAVHGIFAVGFAFLAHRAVKALRNGEGRIPDAASFADGLVVQKVLAAGLASHRQRQWVKP